MATKEGDRRSTDLNLIGRTQHDGLSSSAEYAGALNARALRLIAHNSTGLLRAKQLQAKYSRIPPSISPANCLIILRV